MRKVYTEEQLYYGIARMVTRRRPRLATGPKLPRKERVEKVRVH